MKKWHIFLLVCGFAIHTSAQVPKLVPEHTFDGYYYPYNMPSYNPESNDDRYFYPSLLNINGGHIDAAIYNEDYSIRDRIDCTIDIPNGYKISTVSLSGNMILPNGTKFFIVSFTKETFDQAGYADYVISKAYSYPQGTPLFDIASATSSISYQPMLYVINGKVSLIAMVFDQDPSTHIVNWKTQIYSLGETPSSATMAITQDGCQPYPIRTYDMNGRPVNMDTKGMPVIIQYSNGSVIKTVK